MPYDEVMKKYKAKKLKSGSGKKVTSRKQAIAIMLSEKRASATKPEYRSTRAVTTHNTGGKMKRQRG